MKRKNHSIFQSPKNPKRAKVWRFMDFAKYFSLISSSNLFFSRVDKLGDEYEGSLPVANQKFYTYAGFTQEERFEKMQEEAKRALTQRIIRTWRHANCWFMKSQESYLMWQAYTQSKKHGVVIQSTYSKLQNIKQNFQQEKCKMHLGRVNYIDYAKDRIPIPNDPILPFMHKRHFYEDEQEVRLLIEEEPKERDEADPAFQPLYLSTIMKNENDNRRRLHRTRNKYLSTIIENENDGIKVPINLNKLIEAIYVSPDSEDWFLKLVQDVTKQYIPKFKVNKIQKSMSGDPSY